MVMIYVYMYVTKTFFRISANGTNAILLSQPNKLKL